MALSLESKYQQGPIYRGGRLLDIDSCKHAWHTVFENSKADAWEDRQRHQKQMVRQPHQQKQKEQLTEVSAGRRPFGPAS
jgi:hypothetical protein